MDGAQRSVRDRMMRLLLVMMLVAGMLAIGQDEAQAAISYNCTGAYTSSQTWHTGSTTRWTGGSSNSNIIWSFLTNTGCSGSYLPGGASANLSMRVAFCSGSGGTSGGSTFTYPTARYLATSVKAGTCFRVQWRPNNGATDYEDFDGKIIWTTS